MAEYISREAAYITLTEYYHQRTDIQHQALREALNRIPAADVVEVVRCGGCKYGYTDENTLICGYRGFFVSESFYCAEGERKEQNDDCF